MANFVTPFAATAARRSPTEDEKANGFPCGPADQTLFNGLFYRIEAELGNLIAFAGLTGSDADYSQVRKAIAAMIDTATGGGDTSTYLLTSQAIARLPIFPEILSADGRIIVYAPATGTVRVPGGVDFIHRGINAVTTDETDFATVANKTYHIRWNPDDGFTLKDLANGTYNPSTLAETDASFDTGYDDMLVARVVTNASNVATITNLANLARIHKAHDLAIGAMTSNSGANGAIRAFTLDMNYARTPVVVGSLTRVSTDQGPDDTDNDVINNWSSNRYTISGTVGYDFATEISFRFMAVN